MAKTSTQLLLFLVNDTLDYYQIKSSKFTLRITTFLLADVVEQSFEIVSMQMEQKKLMKYIEIDP